MRKQTVRYIDSQWMSLLSYEREKQRQSQTDIDRQRDRQRESDRGREKREIKRERQIDRGERHTERGREERERCKIFCRHWRKPGITATAQAPLVDYPYRPTSPNRPHSHQSLSLRASQGTVGLLPSTLHISKQTLYPIGIHAPIHVPIHPYHNPSIHPPTCLSSCVSGRRQIRSTRFPANS